MAGARKFAPKYIGRDDVAALTPEAARISGIPLVTDVDRDEAADILGETEREEAEAILEVR
jgi:hypothetical protein